MVGTLMMISPQGAIAVQAGGAPVNTMVSPNVEIEVQMNNLSLAQPGDEVEVAGFYNPPDETKVKAQRITITTERVIGDTANPANGKDRLKPGKGVKTEEGQLDPAAPGKGNATGDANMPGNANLPGQQNIPGGVDSPATTTP